MFGVLVGRSDCNTTNTHWQEIRCETEYLPIHAFVYFFNLSMLWNACWFLTCSPFQLQPSIPINGSIRPSVRPSVCHTCFTIFLSWYQHKIPKNNNYWQKWCPCNKIRGQRPRSHMSKNICPSSGIYECNLSLYPEMATKRCTKLELA